MMQALNREAILDADAKPATEAQSSTTSSAEPQVTLDTHNAVFTATASMASPGIESVSFSFSRQLLPTGGDGNYLDRNGEFVSPNAPIATVAAFEPENGPIKGDPIIYVNGVNTDTTKLAACAQNIADSTGHAVIPLYNHTKGSTVDTLQAVSDKFNLLENPAATSLAGIIVSGFHQDNPPHIMAHSQGALVTSRALFEARATLSKDSRVDLQKLDDYFSRITVETFGGAASVFPPGPRYVHYVNTGDAVSFFLGVGKHGLEPRHARQVEANIDAPSPIKMSLGALYGSRNPVARTILEPGESARVIHIENNQGRSWLEAHQMTVYLNHRRGPEEVHAANSADKAHEPTAVGKFLVALHLESGGSGIVGTVARLAMHLRNARFLVNNWMEHL